MDKKLKKSIVFIGLISAAFMAASIVVILYLGTMTSSACQDIEVSFVLSNEDTGYFSTNYQNARKKFLEAARKADGVIESFKHPELGPDNAPLFIDVASFGSEENTNALVIISGTHGVEGFAGSGIQTGLLSEGIAANLPSDLNLIMIHALNPHGMAHIRRFTEGNVDLNRNFLDHSSQHPENREYEALANVIAPTSISFWTEVKSWGRLLWYKKTRDKDELSIQSVISKGQYSHPKGLFYGGRKNTWSNNMLNSIVRDYLQNKKRVINIDIHTGLGKKSSAEIILNSKVNSPEYKRAIEIWGADMVRTTVTGESVSPHLNNTLKLAVPKMLPTSEVTAVSLEFGTYPLMEVFKALRAENWLHHHAGPKHPKVKQIKTCLLRVFYPVDENWKSKVWNQGKAVVGLAIKNLDSNKSKSQ